MAKEKIVPSRRFLGVFPPKSSFDKKHLKAYLKGYERFTFGLTERWKEPIVHEVKQEYFDLKINEGSIA